MKARKAIGNTLKDSETSKCLGKKIIGGIPYNAEIFPKPTIVLITNIENPVIAI